MAVDVTPPGFEPYADEPVEGVAVGAPGKDGRLDLVFSRDAGGSTRLARDFARAPFHVSGTLDRDPHPDAATVVVQSPTGGVGQGDRRQVSIRAAEDAIAHVTTGSASKVQSMECNYAATETTLSVASGAHLEYVPRATILHADSRYTHDLRIEVARDACAIVGEVVVVGRLARGERFAFDRYRSRIHGFDGEGRRRFEDVTHLAPGDPERRHPSAPGVCGDRGVVGSLVVVAPSREPRPLSDALHEAVTDDTDGSEQCVTGATQLPTDAGVLVRVVGERSAEVRSALLAAWDRARRRLLDVPAPRWAR
jgi:urease accessory protein